MTATSFADRSHNPEPTLGSVWSLQNVFEYNIKARFFRTAQASLAEKEVPVPAVSKESAFLLFQPWLESKEDGGLGSLPHVLPRHVVVRHDHVLDCSGEVAEHFGPDGDLSTPCVSGEILPDKTGMV